MRLYLIRHAQTAWNKEGRAQGHVDTGLDETGLVQASELGRAFHGHQLERVISSDLQRAVQTAEEIVSVTGAHFETTDQLRERSFGKWEGLAYDEIHNRLKAAAAMVSESEFIARPDGGESVQDVWNRLRPFLDRLTELKGDTAVVSHGGTCASILCNLLRANFETARSFRFENTSVTELTRRDDGYWRLVRFGDTNHLSRPSAPMIDAQNLANR